MAKSANIRKGFIFPLRKLQSQIRCVKPRLILDFVVAAQGRHRNEQTCIR